MFEKRLHIDRENRVRKRDEGGPRGEKDGYPDHAHNAGGSAVLFKHKLVQLCGSAVQRLRRKGDHDRGADTHNGVRAVEFENNEIRAVESQLYNISLQLSLYLNAGLVLSAALRELISDMDGSDTAPAKLLRQVYEVSCNKNMPFESVLFDAAKEMKSKDLLRFSCCSSTADPKAANCVKNLKGKGYRCKTAGSATRERGRKRQRQSCAFP